MAVRRTLYLIPIVVAALVLGWPAFLHAENAVRYTDVTAQPGDIVSIDMIMSNDVVISGAYIPFRWSSPDVSLLGVEILRDRFQGVINESQSVVDFHARTSGVFFVRGTGIFEQGWVNAGSGVLAHLTFQVSPEAADQVVYVDSVYRELDGGNTDQTQFSNFQGTQVIFPIVYAGRIVIGSPDLDIIMEVSPESVLIEGTELGFDPPSKTLSLEATNGNRFGWDARWSSNWLTVTPETGSAPSFLTVRAETRDLTQGTYRDTIYISAADAQNSPLAVPVELIVNAPQVRLSASPEAIDLEALRPGQDSVGQTLMITSDAAVPITWTAFANQPWLSLSSGSGETPGFIDVSADLREYPFGEYTDTITVLSDVALNSPLRVPVTIVLDTVGIKIAATPERLLVSGSVLSNQPSVALLRISSNVPGESISWSASWTQPWLVVDPREANVGEAVRADFSTARLDVGVYHDTITIDAPDAKNSPLRVPVEFTVEAGSLAQNYPNPFSLNRGEYTRIGYYLDKPDRIEISMYNALGQKVRTLIAGERGSGEQSVQWDGRDDQGQYVASGHYFYRMTTSKGTVTKRMIVIK